MVIFSSRKTALKVWGEKIVKGKNAGEMLASFAPFGKFSTDDEQLIAKLRDHGSYNKDFVELSKIAVSADRQVVPKGNLRQGIRSSATQPILGEKEKLIRLGTLREKLLKNDGSYRKDAPEEEINELTKIQELLGV